MHRYLLRWRLTPAVTGVAVKAIGNSRTFLGASYSNLLINSARWHTGITYSQWRYWKQVVLARKHRNICCQTHLAPVVSCSRAALSPAPESFNGVFERYAALLESGQFKPESFINFATSLSSAVYSGLSWLPWLHSDNKIIAFMQILMNSRTDDLLKDPLYGHRHFEKIYNHLSTHVDQIPKVDCPTILLCLLYSGLNQEDPLVIKLLNECYDATSQLDMHQLQDLTHVLQSLGGRNFALAEKIVCRMAQILDAPPEEVHFDIHDLCVSNPVVAVYMSPDLLETCVSAMLHNIEKQGPDLDALTIGCCFRYARKMSFRVNRENLARIKLLGKEALDRYSNFDNIQSHHIAEICHNAKRLGCFTGDSVEKIKKRSLQLLKDESKNLQIREVTNLLFAFTRDVPPSLKKELGNLLIQHMDDADVLTLSNIADNMLELGLNDPDLVTLFQWKVMQNIDKIAQYITRLVKILRLLRERLEFDSSFNHQICEILLKLLDRRQGYDPTFVVVVAQFILPNVRTIVPTILMECLMNVIPRCNLSLMLLVLNGLEKMKGPWSRSLHNQVLEIRSQVQQNTGELIKNTTQASQLAQLVKGLHIKSQNRDFVLLDRMMDHYPQLTKTMSRNDYLKTVNVFKRMSHPYYHPEVFEDLTAFAKENYPAVNFFGVLDLVNILAFAAYRPEYFADFTTFAVQVLEDAMEEENIVGQIMLAYYLTIMQIFPDNVLGQIFTFDYLEEMDSIIEAEPDRRLFLKNLMMQLNRSVILECPHLDVPWFHDQYCRELAQTSGSKDFQRNLAFAEEVEGSLQEVMRGLKFVGRNVYSQYFHPIDFEVVLDLKGQPIPSTAVKLLNPADLDYQRVAVMLIGNQQLCANSHRRRGQYLRDRRHLEILGYRVEEIPRYDWNSMALSDWGAKVSYVHNKIYPRSTKDPASSKAAPTSSLDSPVMHPYWK